MPKRAMLPSRALEDIVQPLTALLARLEVLTDTVRRGELTAVADQLAAARASAERLAASINTTRQAMEGDRHPGVTRLP